MKYISILFLLTFPVFASEDHCVDIDVVGEETQSCLIVPPGGKRFVLVDFSFITCGACVQNFPVLAEFAHEISAQVAVNVVLFKHTHADNLAYIAEHPKWFEGHRIGLDQKNKQGKALGLQYAPTMWLFERGKPEPIGQWIGVLGRSDKEEIKKLTAE